MSRPPSASSSSNSASDPEWMRKRARDRRSQQAMRDRTKYALQSLEQRVVMLSQALEDGARERAQLSARLQTLVGQNEALAAQNAALGLRLMGVPPETRGLAAMAWSPLPLPLVYPDAPRPWQQLLCNSPATCIADQILQDFITSQRRLSVGSELGNERRAGPNSERANLSSMLKKERSDDETSNVVGDILRSYSEIETLPKQVAVHYLMSLLFKWMLHQNEDSWNNMPEWLRPLPEQLTIPHPLWVDRIPWPRARLFLIHHPEIDFDQFAAVYSSHFNVSWEYNNAHVLSRTAGPSEGCEEHVYISGIFEEHVRRLKNWTVGEALAKRFPELWEAMNFPK